jgi:hypothetical protein
MRESNDNNDLLSLSLSLIIAAKSLECQSEERPKSIQQPVVACGAGVYVYVM